MQKDKYLILKGCAGLGNRLITVCAAVVYAKKTGRTLFVDWSDGQFGEKDQNVFYQFFDLSGVKHISSLEQISGINKQTIYPHIWEGRLEKGIYDLFEFENLQGNPWINKLLFSLKPKGNLAKVHGYWKPKGYPINGSKLGQSLLPVLNSTFFPLGSYYKTNRSEDIVVFTDFSPVVNESIFQNHIKLKLDFDSFVKEYVNKLELEKNSIGIHIRATDKKPSSLIKNVFHKIDQLNLEKPTIFLATDNKEVARELSAYYEKVITFAENLPEVPEGMGIHQLGFRSGNGEMAMDVLRQSLLDMWLLSHCEYLLYQGNSTFSLISKYMHKNQNHVFDWQKNNMGK